MGETEVRVMSYSLGFLPLKSIFQIAKKSFLICKSIHSIEIVIV